jgi:hypothetical protein
MDKPSHDTEGGQAERVRECDQRQGCNTHFVCALHGTPAACECAAGAGGPCTRHSPPSRTLEAVFQSLGKGWRLRGGSSSGGGGKGWGGVDGDWHMASASSAGNARTFKGGGVLLHQRQKMRSWEWVCASVSTVHLTNPEHAPPLNPGAARVASTAQARHNAQARHVHASCAPENCPGTCTSPHLD